MINLGCSGFLDLSKLGFGVNDSGSGLTQLYAPTPLHVIPKSTTEININWTDMNVDSFTLERSTNSDYSSSSVIYSGTARLFADTGLTIGTTYYYRVKAIKAGYTDSAWVTDSAQTYSTTPEFFYDFTGAKSSTDNEYATATSGTTAIDVIKSIVNTSGPTSTPNATKALIINGSNTSAPNTECAYPIGTFAAKPYNLSSAISIPLNGLFTLMIKMSFNAAPSNHRLTIDLTDINKRIQFGSLTSFSFIPTGVTARTIDVTSFGLTTKRSYSFAMKRKSGNILSISHDGGTTELNAAVADGAAFQIGQLFGGLNVHIEMVALVKAELTVAQMSEYFNRGEKSAYAPQVISSSSDLITVGGVTYSPYTGPYITDATLSADTTSSSQRGQRMLTIGDKTLFIVSKDFATYFGVDRVYVYDHTTGKIGAPLELATYGTNTDVHNTHSFTEYDRKLMFMMQYPHYEFTPNNLYITTSAPNFDLSKITSKIIRGGAPATLAATSQYDNITVLSNGKILISTQGWDGSNGGIVHNFVSPDAGNSWRKVQLANTDTANDWFYPICPYNSVVGDWHYTVIMQLAKSNNKYNYAYLVKTQDGITFYNMSGSYSKNVSANNYLTPTELQTNCLIMDASALTERCQVTSVHVDSSGIVHMIMGDGNGGWQLVFWNGTSWTKRVINFGGKNIVTSTMAEGVAADIANYLHVKGSGSYDLYIGEKNGGGLLPQPVRFRTTDGGLNWTYDTSWISGLDTTKTHVRINGTQNSCYNNKVAIMATARSGANYSGKFLFHPITN